MYFCNAQLIISPWKLRNINSQFIILFIYYYIPEQVQNFVNGIRFRFLFYHDENQPSCNVTTRYVLSYGEPAWYPTDVYYV